MKLSNDFFYETCYHQHVPANTENILQKAISEDLIQCKYLLKVDLPKIKLSSFIYVIILNEK